MSRNRQLDGPLSGLVSPAAEALYTQLERRSPESPADLTSDAARELLDAGVLDPAGTVVSRMLATQLLLARRHEEIETSLRRIRQGWQLMETLVQEASAGGPAVSGSGVELISGTTAIHQIAAELYRTTRRQLRSVMTSYVGPIETTNTLLTPTEPAKAAGARFRTLYEESFALHEFGARIVQQSVDGGEEARVCARLPGRLFHVDDSIALVALTNSGLDGAALVRAKPLLRLLADWFDAVWDAPETTDFGVARSQELTADQQAVLRLLASGMTDDTIARTLGASVKTVRRNVGAILDVLGVTTRLAAGAAAAKRGWV